MRSYGTGTLRNDRCHVILGNSILLLGPSVFGKQITGKELWPAFAKRISDTQRHFCVVWFADNLHPLRTDSSRNADHWTPVEDVEWQGVLHTHAFGKSMPSSLNGSSVVKS
jgi:hypothetical protein